MTFAARSLLVAQTWDGQPAPRSDWVKVELALSLEDVAVTIDAPFHGDAPPPTPPGPTPGLWNHEVVELFLLGEGDQYLELELGPHGHFLVLELCGQRHVVREIPTLDYRVRQLGDRFVGQASIPLGLLPAGLHSLNAYAVHGPEDARQYLAWRGAPGRRPDFHRLETFGPLGWEEQLADLQVPVRIGSRRNARAAQR
jgi:hypothetical protein